MSSKLPHASRADRADRTFSTEADRARACRMNCCPVFSRTTNDSSHSETMRYMKCERWEEERVREEEVQQRAAANLSGGLQRCEIPPFVHEN
eukprot:2007239-Rhodomonas_salina.1